VEVIIKKCVFFLQGPENDRITSLKHYLCLVEIHNIHYSKVLQKCQSNKAKIDAFLVC